MLFSSDHESFDGKSSKSGIEAVDSAAIGASLRKAELARQSARNAAKLVPKPRKQIKRTPRSTEQENEAIQSLMLKNCVQVIQRRLRRYRTRIAKMTQFIRMQNALSAQQKEARKIAKLARRSLSSYLKLLKSPRSRRRLDIEYNFHIRWVNSQIPACPPSQYITSPFSIFSRPSLTYSSPSPVSSFNQINILEPTQQILEIENLKPIISQQVNQEDQSSSKYQQLCPDKLQLSNLPLDYPSENIQSNRELYLGPSACQLEPNDVKLNRSFQLETSVIEYIPLSSPIINSKVTEFFKPESIPLDDNKKLSQINSTKEHKLNIFELIENKKNELAHSLTSPKLKLSNFLQFFERVPNPSAIKPEGIFNFTEFDYLLKEINNFLRPERSPCIPFFPPILCSSLQDLALEEINSDNCCTLFVIRSLLTLVGLSHINFLSNETIEVLLSSLNLSQTNWFFEEKFRHMLAMIFKGRKHGTFTRDILQRMVDEPRSHYALVHFVFNSLILFAESGEVVSKLKPVDFTLLTKSPNSMGFIISCRTFLSSKFSKKDQVSLTGTISDYSAAVSLISSFHPVRPMVHNFVASLKNVLLNPKNHGYETRFLVLRIGSELKS